MWMTPAITATLVLALFAPACSRASSSAAPASDGASSTEREPRVLGDGARDLLDSSGPLFDARPGDAGAASVGASKQAEECLASPTCPATEAARLFVAASDADDPEVDCFRFVDGMGTALDVKRAPSVLRSPDHGT